MTLKYLEHHLIFLAYPRLGTAALWLMILFDSQTKYLEKQFVIRRIKMREKKLTELTERLEKSKKNYEDKQKGQEKFNRDANQLVKVIEKFLITCFIFITKYTCSPL